MNINKHKELVTYLNKLIEKEDFSQALEVLDSQDTDDNENIELLFIMAKIYHQTQYFGKAINILQKILKIDPDQKEAKNYIALIQDILRYTNSDIYASPNTTHDPWLE